MYKTIKRRVSQTTNGTYKHKDRHFDFEKLPWVQWLDIEPLTKEQKQIFRLLYPILLQEINTKHPSSLLHYLVGRGVLFWQDVIVIRSRRQTDMEQNSPFLRIIRTRGQAGYYALIDGLRSRYGGWQGYLADMLEGRFGFVALRDISDIYKIVCHDMIKVTPVGWSVLPRVLGLNPDLIEKARRENKLLTNQLLHSLLMWTGHRDDTNQLLNDLLIALYKINREDIARGIVMLLSVVQSAKEVKTLPRTTEAEDDDPSEHLESTSPRVESGISTLVNETMEAEETSEHEREALAMPKGQLSRKSFDSRFYTSPKSNRRSASVPIGSPTPPRSQSPRKFSVSSYHRTYRKTPTLREIHAGEIVTRKKSDVMYASNCKICSVSFQNNEDCKWRAQSGNVYSYELTPRRSSNVWERRRPSILQMDYMNHPNHDNIFMDYLVYH